MNPLTCHRCEHIGYDVQSRIVEIDEPQRVIGGPLAGAFRTTFRREARCISQEDCDARHLRLVCPLCGAKDGKHEKACERS